MFPHSVENLIFSYFANLLLSVKFLIKIYFTLFPVFMVFLIFIFHSYFIAAIIIMYILLFQFLQLAPQCSQCCFRGSRQTSMPWLCLGSSKEILSYSNCTGM